MKVLLNSVLAFLVLVYSTGLTVVQHFQGCTGQVRAHLAQWQELERTPVPLASASLPSCCQKPGQKSAAGALLASTTPTAVQFVAVDSDCEVAHDDAHAGAHCGAMAQGATACCKLGTTQPAPAASAAGCNPDTATEITHLARKGNAEVLGQNRGCCHFDFFAFQLDDYTSSSDAPFAAVALASVALHTNNGVALRIAARFAQQPQLAAQPPPPSCYNRSLLAQYQVFRV
jgi:hypothetical protein